jgi:hypothetical protein
MPLIAPILDDRAFEDLYAELRGRIPVYNPEWTDHNESDPGITLLQLFAYLGEGLQFRFNQIPEATRIAWLKLLGLPLRPARAANALLRCTSKSQAGVAVYGGDQVKASKILYTVSQDAVIWPFDCVALCKKPLLTDPASQLSGYLAGLDPELRAAVQGGIDAVKLADASVSAVAPYESVLLEPDGKSDPVDFADSVDACVWVAVLKDPAVVPQNAPGRAISLSLGYVPGVSYPDLATAPACGAGAPPSLEWRASLAALDKNGQPAYLALRAAGDSSGGFTRAGVARIDLPVDTSVLGVPVAPEGLAGSGEYPPILDDSRADQLWFWLRVWRGDGSRIGTTQLITLNALTCEQAVSATPELLGTGIGQPGQVFQLANAPVLADARNPVRLQVEEGGVWSDWSQVDNFDASGREDRHFTLDAEAGTVKFGDWRFPRLGERIRVKSYRWGGGALGNVPAGAINKLGALLATTPATPLIRPGGDLKLSNPLPAGGGLDSESVADALDRIPGELRHNRRAVARDDFSDLALETPGAGIGRAECLPLFHAPSQTYRAGNVSVVVWPASDPIHPNAPTPDNFQLAQVCAWLDQSRLVTTELHVIPPTYHRLAISLSVQVKDGYGLDAVRDWVELLLRQYLAPLPPYGPDGAGWPLGRSVRARELEGVAMQAEGVEYIDTLRLASADGSGWDEQEVVTLADWEVPTVAVIVVVANDPPPPGQDLAPPPATPPVPVPVLKDEC